MLMTVLIIGSHFNNCRNFRTISPQRWRSSEINGHVTYTYWDVAVRIRWRAGVTCSAPLYRCTKCRKTTIKEYAYTFNLKECDAGLRMSVVVISSTDIRAFIWLSYIAHDKVTCSSTCSRRLSAVC